MAAPAITTPCATSLWWIYCGWTLWSWETVAHILCVTEMIICMVMLMSCVVLSTLWGTHNSIYHVFCHAIVICYFVDTLPRVLSCCLMLFCWHFTSRLTLFTTCSVMLSYAMYLTCNSIYHVLSCCHMLCYWHFTSRVTQFTTCCHAIVIRYVVDTLPHV